MVRRKLLFEMAVYDETEVYAMNPVASVSTLEVDNLEGEELRCYVYRPIQQIAATLNYNISENDIGVLIRHHCGHRKRKSRIVSTTIYS